MRCLAFLLLAACGDDPAAVPVDATPDAQVFDVTCTLATGFNYSGAECATWSDQSAADADKLRTSCTANDGTPGSACALANLVGCCRNPNQAAVTDCYYAPGDRTAAQLELDCQQISGTWQAMP